jgi:hypothetical protein
MRFKNCTTEIQQNGVLRIRLSYDFTKTWLKRVVQKDAEALVERLREEGFFCSRIASVSTQKAEVTVHGLTSIHDARANITRLLEEL